MAPDALHFIISRGVVGIGYGFSFMAAQGFVISYTDEKTKAQGLTQLFAGLFAGSICGGAAGAMLAERIGYQPVFFVGAVIVVLVMLYTISFMRGAIEKPSQRIGVKLAHPIKIRQIVRFLFNRNVLSLILFSSFPAAMALIGFIHYFCPLYLNRIGASQSNIGRVYMVYGICLIYLAPFISKYVDASNNKKSYIILAGLLGSLAFTSFYFLGGIIAAAFAIMMLGLAASFGSGSQNAYMLKLSVTHELGQGKAMGMYRSANRVGQVVGPMIFGGLIITRDLNEGITYFGAVYLLATIFFFIIAQKDQKAAQRKAEPS
jgi:predicted MFS family arabinose efflux permease